MPIVVIGYCGIDDVDVDGWTVCGGRSDHPWDEDEIEELTNAQEAESEHVNQAGDVATTVETMGATASNGAHAPKQIRNENRTNHAESSQNRGGPK